MFFKQQHFDLLIKYKDQIRDKEDPKQNEAYEILKQANDLTKIWGEAVIGKLFNHGHVGGFRNRPTNQGNKFKHYTWAKIYPRKNAPKQLAYTVGLDSYSGFIVKIDTVGDIGDKRKKYEALRGDFDDRSHIVAILSIEEGLEKSLDELVSWSIEEIQKFGFTYDDLCVELELEDDIPHIDFTAQQVLDYLKLRYSNSEYKTQKIFLCVNELGKELALETANLSTTTVRIFIQDQPPDNIIEQSRCKLIPRNSTQQSPNSNLNTNTTTLRSEDNFYQVSPNTQEELLYLCDWLDEIENKAAIGNLDNQGMESTEVDKTLNRILFGAAGTGKTYHTVNHALSILDDKPLKELELEDRATLKADFDRYIEQGRIKFVTFHQSFSYEDFVEGIRADTKDGELIYDVKPGVFKEICDRIKKEQTQIECGDKVVTDESIQTALDRLIEEAADAEIPFLTKTNYEFMLRTNQNGKLTARAISGKGSSISLSHPAIIRYLKEQSDEIVANKSYEWAIAKSLRSEVQYEIISDKPAYVLIIDEINRGNISRIFGELITLIEESKRAGADEALSVTLPYSKEEFSVPDNVYIIGTMNSSDRSLTGLDIALRRRFTFIEMQPNPHAIQNKEGGLLKISDKDSNGKEGEVTVADLLSVMNQRIEVLLDRDHCIGHANFMSLKDTPTLAHLADIFKQKIIPQLQEYFFDDWGKIDLVLNRNGMLAREDNSKIFALFPTDVLEEFGYLNQKTVWTIKTESFDKLASYQAILGNQVNS